LLLDDAAFRIGSRHPLVVGNLLLPLLLPLFVEATQVFVVVDLDTGIFGQAPQVILPVLAGVTADDPARPVGLQRTTHFWGDAAKKHGSPPHRSAPGGHCGVRFQSRGVDAHRFSDQQFLPPSNVQHEREHLLEENGSQSSSTNSSNPASSSSRLSLSEKICCGTEASASVAIQNSCCRSCCRRPLPIKPLPVSSRSNHDSE